MKIIQKISFGLMALALSASAFPMTSISFFGGNNYVIGNKNAWSLEFLYDGAWKYGDNFFFFDATNPHRNTTTISGEWTTRLSYSKITGKTVKLGPISDVLLATEMNLTGQNMRQYGLGLGTNYAVPHFSHLTLNTFWVHNDTYTGQTYQLALVWTMPFAINDRFHLLFGGLADYIGPMKTKSVSLKGNFMMEPSLMLDLGHALNMSTNKLFVGLQYSYWHNMLGTSLTQSVPEVKLTWVL